MIYLGQEAIGLATRTGNTASGEFVLDAASSGINIIHNLSTNKIFIIAQRINSDHSNINNTNRYQNVLFYGITKEALNIDETQTYSYNGGTQASYKSNVTTDSAYPYGVYSYFPAETGTVPTMNIVSNNGWFAPNPQMVTPINLNEVFVFPRYQLCPGRWVWRAYALD